jgi:hypothetical protein
MINTVVIVYLVALYLSIPGFLRKAGIKFYYGLIPIINIYFLCKALNMNPLFMIIYGALLTFTPFKDLLVTALVIFLPFMIMDAYEDNILYSFAALILPFVLFPLVAYFHGTYQYGGENIELF